jgi:hypothetical protein
MRISGFSFSCGAGIATVGPDAPRRFAISVPDAEKRSQLAMLLDGGTVERRHF